MALEYYNCCYYGLEELYCCYCEDILFKIDQFVEFDWLLFVFK